MARGRGSPLFALVYAATLAAAVAAFLLVRSGGETLAAPEPSSAVTADAPAAAPRDAGNPLPALLLALTAVIVLGQLLGRVFARFGQPAVIGEMTAGILLGPSVLGPEASAWILPPSVAPYLGIVAQLGIVLYMFTVGLELNATVLRERARSTIVISHASITAPFLLGSVLALYLYPRLSSADVPFTSFALFLGVAMSITAFPVLARILADRGMSRTKLGVVALACAAIDDVTAWCLLALVVGVARAQIGGAALVAAGALVFIAAMVFVARPLFQRAAARWDDDRLPRGSAALVLVALLVSTLATELIGIHAIFGAFLLGAVIPHDSAIARSFTRQLEHVVTILFLPAFFAFTGMRTRIDLVTGPGQWLLCGLIVLVAVAGKFGGTWIAARLSGIDPRGAAVLGALMNTRGLMELVVLNIGLDLGVISPTLFSMMVVMAIVTTVATAPALTLLRAPRGRPGD